MLPRSLISIITCNTVTSKLQKMSPSCAAPTFHAMDERSEAKCLFNELPNELRHHIYKLCSVNAKLCLKMCCKTLRDETLGTPRGLYYDLNRTIDFGNARFDRLCLDDTYTGSKTKRHVCIACFCLHREEEFMGEQLQEGPRTRVCEASQRSLNLTPFDYFTYQQLVHSRNVPLPLAFPYDECFTFRPVDDDRGQWMIIMDWFFETRYPPHPVGLRHLLENFPLCACPHLMSFETQVFEAVISYSDDKDANPAFAMCSTCNTKIEFALPTIPPDNEENWCATTGISFHVERRIGRLGESAVDARWKAQSLPVTQI